MKTWTRLSAVILSGLCAQLAGAQPAAKGSAHAFPTKPVRMIIAVPPGGAADFAARIVGQRLTEAFGQNVVSENRGGAGGTIASD
ncbi:MAG: hypothetical protein HYU76_10470 [Betaproteobacteria bacterium]|nr:hypothetical protein [Betaproteobacteria bacterium]